MLRFLVNLLLAHAVASYGVLLAVTLRYGDQGFDVWLVAPAWAPVAVWDVSTDLFRFDKPWLTLAAVDGSYATCFAATLLLRRRTRRRSLRSRRLVAGRCTECGYDLTGNVSGTCPECGEPTAPKARLLRRMLAVTRNR